MLCQEIPNLKLPRRQQYLRKPGSQTPGLTKNSNVPAKQLDLLFPRRDY